MNQTRDSPDFAEIRGDVEAAASATERKHRDEIKKKEDNLKKLWDSYTLQERDLDALKDKMAFLEQEMLQKDSVISNLRTHVESKDSRIRDMEMDLIALKRFKEESEPKVRTLEQQLRASDDRYAKVLRMWQATFESAKFWRKACEERDAWFDRHIGAFGDFKRAMDDREDMIARHRKEAAGLELEVATRKAQHEEAAAKAAKAPK